MMGAEKAIFPLYIVISVFLDNYEVPEKFLANKNKGLHEGNKDF
jgi:hypothetical protein